MVILYFTLALAVANTIGYRTSTCLRSNEEFSLCGWKCPPTCVNLRLMAEGGTLCTSIWECKVGCRCSAGYIRDEYSKLCVLVQDCPEQDVKFQQYGLLLRNRVH